MAETLGMLFDKLSIVKLKQYHSDDSTRLKSLDIHAELLINEIDEYVQKAFNDEVPFERLTFAANKVYKKEGNQIKAIEGSIGKIASQLADVNCRLWHVQEKVYEFDKIAVDEKNYVVKQLAVLNLERNNCIDEIDRQFSAFIVAL